MAEFLPLCDVLFNVISLAGYFCDVVFDVVMGYALLERGYKGTFAAAISIVITSLLISQVLSLRWYLHVWWAGEGRKGRPPWLPIVLHCLQLGVLWRYARLLVPVELRRVKHQVRDLCMLRLVHAFCEAAPMLLLQLHILFKDTNREPASDLVVTPEPSIDEPSENKAFAELNVISASLSLFSVCWALASFSKNVRLQNVHRLVLTWLGVIFQFLWRLGTISARICALTVYALVYEYWVFLVIGLHWLSMFLWLISPKNVFHGERISRPRKAYLSALIAFVYVFAYVNLQELNHRQKMVTFYCVMCVENWLLVTAWWWSGRAVRPGALAAVVGAAFFGGIAFMLIYYRMLSLHSAATTLDVPEPLGTRLVNALDLAPNYAGTLTSLVNTTSTFAGIITPYLIGLLTPDSTLAQWRVAFWVCFAVLVGTNIIYCIWADGKQQWWDDVRQFGYPEGWKHGPLTRDSVEIPESVRLSDHKRGSS